MTTKVQKFIFAMLIAFISVASSAEISASAVVSGTPTATTFAASVYPTSQFIGNGSKIWFAVLRQNVVYFHSAESGFVAYKGGDATAFMEITTSNELIYFSNWDTSSNGGDEVFIGYGTSFSDMAENSRFVRVYTFPAIGSTSGPASLSLSPTSLSFGEQKTGTRSSAKTLTLSNTSSNTLLISSITASDEFALETNCGTSVVARANCIVNVSFRPVSGGAKRGNVVVESSNASTYTLALSGFGVIPPAVPSCTVTASPSTIALGGTSLLTGSCGTNRIVDWGDGICPGGIGPVYCRVSPAVTTTYYVRENFVICSILGTCGVVGMVTVTVNP